MTTPQKAMSDVVKKSKNPLFLQHRTFYEGFEGYNMRVMLYKTGRSNYFYNVIYFYVVKILHIKKVQHSRLFGYDLKADVSVML